MDQVTLSISMRYHEESIPVIPKPAYQDTFPRLSAWRLLHYRMSEGTGNKVKLLELSRPVSHH